MIGSHWFNPPPQMKLIEVIRGIETSDATLEATLALAQQYGKETIVCRKDTPGFVTSRLIASFMVEAARIVEEGIADIEDVDKACKLGFGHAMGPLLTADLSGLDTVERVADNLARTTATVSSAADDQGARQCRPPGPQDRPRPAGLR